MSPTSRRWPMRCMRMARSPASSCGTAAATSRTSPAASPASACARCPRARTRFSRGAWTRRTSAHSANGISRRPGARKAAGFDIIYVYPTHGYLVSEFLSRSLNERTDEYGGSLVNRVRLFRELLEETREAVGDRCAVAVRFSANGHGEEHLTGEEARDVLGLMGHMPDLWDLVIDDYYEEMGSSRFLQRRPLGERDRLRSRPDRQARGQRRPLHLPRHDGAPDQERGSRPHRRGAPLDRRSVSADQDPRGPPTRTFASASAATSATPTTTAAPPFAARRTRPWARNGAAAGIPSACRRAIAAPCSSSAPARPASRPRTSSASGAIR